MSRRSLILTLIAVLTLSAALIPFQVRAGGVCGGAYTVEKGDTVNALAVMCGTSASAIFAANPGLTEPLTAGQSITIPGANYGVPTTAVVTGTAPSPTPTVNPALTPTPVTVINNYTYNYYNYSPIPVVSPAPVISTGTYVVQPGDTFAGIAYSFGVSINDLWAANPYIVDINLLYVGQVLNIPFWYIPAPGVVAPVATSPASAAVVEPVERKYAGTIPMGAPQGEVRLLNKSDSEVYISLRISRADGTNAIYEYPVKGNAAVNVPAGWIDYVAWVGGVKFTGGFKLGEDSYRNITFNRSKVVVD